MEKTYHFMAGLPRSGSTVLSALLNQHPEIYSSPQTHLSSMLYELNESIPNYESHRADLFIQGYENVKASMADNFYAHINKPVIIDKNRSWGTPYNFERLSGYLNVRGKVIITLRPILEVLASFVKVIENNGDLNVGQPFMDYDTAVSHYRNFRDARVDNIMRTNGEIDVALFSIAHLLTHHSDRVFIVWFSDLTENPQLILDQLYEFLEVDNFKNDFNSIVSADIQNDLKGYGIPNLHKLNKKLTNASTKPEDYLSDYSIAKYRNALDFLGF